MSVAMQDGQTGSQPRPRALFLQPRALQWFEDGKQGVQTRSSQERQAGRFELFLDLLYVAILANFAEGLADHTNGDQLVKYILIFVPAWHVWSDLREIMNSFYNDDLAQRLLILWIMALLVMYGNNARIVDEDIGAMRSTVASYLAARVSGMIAHLVYSFSSYHHRRQQRLWVLLSLFTLCLFIPLFVEDLNLRSKAAVAWVAIIAEECAWFFSYSPVAKRLLKAKYTTAVDVPHEVDRFAAFFIIVLGEFLYRIIVGSPAVIGFNLGLLRAIWTLVIAFSLNWMYVHGSGSLVQIHPLKHSVTHAYAWVFLHLPLVASLLAGGHAAANTAVYSEEYPREEIWLLCGGLGCGVIMLWLIASLGECGDAPGVLILPKHSRLALRPIIGIIICCLPLADDHLGITSITSIIMALFALTVLYENITSLQRGAKFWEKWEGTDYPKPSDTIDQSIEATKSGRRDNDENA
ncbi:uncharacterized protein PV09_03944 [Verruconis gallopava]|uniref:Low temperature requirement protein LtrA n=1 Tax=Verruconis gallopava TaxID=253628 RepID=A0A0D2B2B6_9PEZI|nr:uncharacterized protein PV09_03944 [Verruconis gallopava]KIW05434.1 hypothetical protein PV09_03944 [Verruconis gallopava]